MLDGERLAARLVSPELSGAGWAIETLGRESYRVTLPDTLRSAGMSDPTHPDIDELLALAASLGVLVESVEPARSTLEEVFLGAVDDRPGHASGISAVKGSVK